MELEKLRIYEMSVKLAEEIWDLVIQWKYFEKDTIGKQLIRSADSISANISEGIGRYHYKECRNFCYFARGSLFETRTWLEKSKNRKLISQSDFEKFSKNIMILGASLNSFINSIGRQK